jgi:PEP-CTERM motif
MTWKTTRKLLVYCTAAVGVAGVGSAHATPMVLTLSAQDITAATPANVVVFCDVGSAACTAAGVSNSVAPTILGTPNAISVGAGTQGAIQFTSENASSVIGTGPIYNNLLTTDALTVKNNSPNDVYALTASLTGYNFQGPDSVFSVTGNGEFITSGGSQMQLNWFDDPNNAGTSDASTQINTFTSTPANPNLFSYATTVDSAPLPNPDTGLYSMTETWNYTLAPGGELTNRGQTEDKIFTPEPATLLLLGAGIFGLGIVRRRKST